MFGFSSSKVESRQRIEKRGRGGKRDSVNLLIGLDPPYEAENFISDSNIYNTNQVPLN